MASEIEGAKFAVGDIVGLKCGGIAMVVTNLYRDDENEDLIYLEAAFHVKDGTVEEVCFNQDAFLSATV